MPIPWLLVLQSVPWTEVIKNAPKVAEGAKKLWNTVSKNPAAGSMPGDQVDVIYAKGEVTISILQARLVDLEKATADLHNQMLASSELIKTLAEQNAQLVRHIEINSKHVRWLTMATLLISMIAIVSLFVVVSR